LGLKARERLSVRLQGAGVKTKSRWGAFGPHQRDHLCRIASDYFGNESLGSFQNARDPDEDDGPYECDNN
jgi:hypothetical protein